jgi:hypothetical protein
VHGENALVAQFLREAESRGHKTRLRGRIVTVDLADGGSTKDLFLCAADADVTILELRPLARAFA